MDALLSAIERISTPLLLGALAIFVLVLLFRQLFFERLPTVLSGATAQLITTLVNQLLVLSLVGLLLGVLGKAVPNIIGAPLASAEIGSRPVRLKITNEPIRNILLECARQTDLVLALEPSVKGTMSIEANNASLSDVLGQVCKAANCSWEILEKPPTLFVRTRR